MEPGDRRTLTLGETPRTRVEIVEDRTAGSRCDEGFLKLRRLSLRNHYEDGTSSAVYAYDLVERAALDAVAIVIFARIGGALAICLRTALRPPLALRPSYTLPIRESEPAPVQWEVPAGLVEPHEDGEDGLRACCAREALEETGFAIDPRAFAPLGPAAALSPGVLAEKIHYFAAEVDPNVRSVPTEDGTPTEERAEILFVPIDEALAACRDGRIADLKTEAAIRRLAERRG